MPESHHTLDTAVQRASAMYRQVQERITALRSTRMYASYQPRPGSLEAASLAQLEAHFVACAQAQDRYWVRMDPVALWGRTPEQLWAVALRRAQAHLRRATAYERDSWIAAYPEDVAREIVYTPHTSRTYPVSRRVWWQRSLDLGYRPEETT